MNCRVAMALALSWLWLPAPVSAQASLVSGSVRDRQGAPIEAATVTARDPSGRVLATGQTARDGTFSLAARSVAGVEIACRYCVRTRVAVVAGEPVVAIVTRFEALADAAPSPADLAALPYAHVENALGLRPFALLRQSSSLLPGAQLADRGLLPAGALTLDAGVPAYDFTFGASPYYGVPTGFAADATIASPASSFAYGDRTGSGTVALDPFAGANAGVLTVGGNATVQASIDSPAIAAVAGASQSTLESRQRADGRWTIPLSAQQTLSFYGSSAAYRQTYDGTSVAGNDAVAAASFDDVAPALDFNAAASFDRDGYTSLGGGAPLSNLWSDAGVSAGIRTNGRVAALAGISNRLSTGIYDGAGEPRIAGTLSQTHAFAGLDATGDWYRIVAGVGWLDAKYTGGSDGQAVPSQTALATPSLRADVFDGKPWSATLEGSSGFALPTLWAQYSYYVNGGVLTYDRSTTYAATLHYTDEARLRFDAEIASQRSNGNVNGPVTSDGFGVTWQVAPLLALRAWTMNVVTATTLAIGGPAGTPASVGSVWLTYENAGSLRCDAIYRRDLLDDGPFYHLDGSISGPLSGPIRWYAGVEDLRHTTALGIGLRIVR